MTIFIINYSQIQYNLSQNPHLISHRNRKKTILKSIWNHKRPQIAQTIQSKKNNVGGTGIPDFKIYYRARVTKEYGTGTNVMQSNEKKIEDPNMSAYNFSHLIFDKDTKNISWRRENIFNKCFWENWMSTCRRVKLDLCLSP